jgi:undecaprenyl diphosphate synthase
MKIPYHIGIIPDGNRRYAKREGISLEKAYLIGADIALSTIQWAKDIGVKHISLFGTSHENVLARPDVEITALRKGVVYFCDKVIEQGIALHLVGNIGEIAQSPKEKQLFLKFSKESKVSDKFTVHADVNYSGEIRNELQPLFESIKKYGIEKIEKNPEKFISSADVPPVDLVIRVGGKPRLSGFLPFQTTYAELYFRDELWGDFNKQIFDEAIQWFKKQDRTKGA